MNKLFFIFFSCFLLFSPFKSEAMPETNLQKMLSDKFAFVFTTEKNDATDNDWNKFVEESRDEADSVDVLRKKLFCNNIKFIFNSINLEEDSKKKYFLSKDYCAYFQKIFITLVALEKRTPVGAVFSFGGFDDDLSSILNDENCYSEVLVFNNNNFSISTEEWNEFCESIASLFLEALKSGMNVDKYRDSFVERVAPIVAKGVFIDYIAPDKNK